MDKLGIDRYETISFPIQNKNNNLQDSSRYSTINNSSIFKKNIYTPLKSNSISKIFLNSKSTNYKNRLNKYIYTSENNSLLNENSKNNKIKLFDRPIYNFIFKENEKKNQKYNRLILKRKSNNKIIKQNHKNKFYNLIFNLKKGGKNLNLSENNKNIENFEYFPKLLDSRACVINKNSDKYKNKNILFAKLKELNFEKEVRNITKNNFITSDKYLTINKEDKTIFLEKKTTYKILENIKFRFKSPTDKSKLQKYVENFKSLYTINYVKI